MKQQMLEAEVKELKARIETLTAERDNYNLCALHSGDVVAAAEAEIERMRAQLAEDADVRTQIDHRLEELVGQVNALTADKARLRDALTFYADEENYKGYTHTDPCGCCSSWHEPKIHIDGEDSGHIARAAIAALNTGKETK
jgi:DNA repair exonuclease SbcCD ATPase subunit